MRSKRAPQRREVLKTLADVKSRLAWLTGQWNVTTRVYLELHELAAREVGDSYLRERRQDEYPEYQQQQWLDLDAQAAEIIRELQQVRQLASQWASQCSEWE